jgi:hypothetical protein
MAPRSTWEEGMSENDEMMWSNTRMAITGEAGAALSAAVRNGGLAQAERDSMAWEAAIRIRASLSHAISNADCVAAGYQFAADFLAERDKQRGGK